MTSTKYFAPSLLAYSHTVYSRPSLLSLSDNPLSIVDVICDYFLILREIMSGKDNKKTWTKMLGITIEKEHDAWEHSPHGEVRL